MDKFKHVSRELFTNFNEVIYYDEPHKYYLGNKELISVTTLIHKYVNEFDSHYWSDYKADQLNIPQEKVLEAWEFINKKGTMKGSIIHDYAENRLLNKVFEYPKEKILNEFGFDPIWEEYLITKKHVDKFIEDIRGKLIPIKTELILYDKEALIGGMCDILFYNVKHDEFQIWDHKTNKDLSFDNNGKYLDGELSVLGESDIEIYSLQLETYKQIIERNTSIKLGKSYIVWYSHNNENYEIIPTYNRKYYIEQMFNERIKAIAT
ncbi:MAG: hypothetical protein ACOC33_03520 [bacterium]